MIQQKKILTDSKRDIPYGIIETTLTNRLLRHERQLLNFLFYVPYEPVYLNPENKQPSYISDKKKEGRQFKILKIQQMRKMHQQISEKLHNRILRDDIDLEKTLGRLQLIWSQKDIPFFHRFYFEKNVYTAYLKNIYSLVQNQQKMIRQQSHIYFNITKAIFARQSCLKALKFSLSELSTSDVSQYIHLTKQQIAYAKRKHQKQKYQFQGFKVEQENDFKSSTTWKTKFQIFMDNFTNLKKLTFYVIDLIMKWKQYIYSLTHDPRKKREKITYYFQMEESYFLKILRDLNFLYDQKNLPLSQFYKFAPKNDPFLLAPILFLQQETQTDNVESILILKSIIFPHQQQYYEIMRKLEVLGQQYDANIMRRRLGSLPKKYDSLSKIDQPQVLIGFKKGNSLKHLNVKKKQIQQIQTKKHNLIKQKLNPIPQTLLISTNPNRRRVIQLGDSGIKLSSSRLTSNIDHPSDNQGTSRLVFLKDAFSIEKGLYIQKKDAQIKKYLPKRTNLNEGNLIPQRTIVTLPPLVQQQSTAIQQKNQKNQQQLETNKILLSKLKQSVVKKLKIQFQSKQTIGTEVLDFSKKKDPLQILIQQQLNKQLFQLQNKNRPPSSINLSFQLLTKSFSEDQLTDQINRIFQKFPEKYLEIQILKNELQVAITKSFSCLILQSIIQTGGTKIGYLFCQRQLINNTISSTASSDFRMKVHHIMTYNIDNIFQLILKAVDFIWKYESQHLKQIQFTFFQRSDKQELFQLVKNLTKKLQNLCLIVTKQIYHYLRQIRFIFRRTFNGTLASNGMVKWSPSNKYPLNLYIQSIMILSLQPLENLNSQINQSANTVYEYILAQILRTSATSDDIITLRERCNWRQRLKKILDLILRQEKGQIDLPQTQLITIQTQTIGQLNKKLRQDHQKLLELADYSLRNNKVKYMRMRCIYGFPHMTLQYARIRQKKNMQYYRMKINGRIDYIQLQNQSSGQQKGYWLMPANTNQKLIILSAKAYQKKYFKQDQQKNLFLYMSRIVEFSTKKSKQVRCFWLPMIKPSKQKDERDQSYVRFKKLNQLSLVHKQLYYHEQAQFFNEIVLPNGIQIEIESGDIVIEPPYILGVTIGNILLYSKLIKQ